jgi:16S rRNA (guanine966-N2)-methyltransferase
MRIVGGIHKGRRLAVPPGRDIRPTADRAREAVFNILAHGRLGAGAVSPVVGRPVIGGAVVLDAFCGTGAMGLEALSRGAARAVFIDNEPAALAAARANIAALGEGARSRIIAADATRPLPRPRDVPPATLAFFDPPYAARAGAAALSAFAAEGWLAPGALCLLEEAARGPESTPPDGFTAIDVRRYGAARLLFLRFG